MALSADRSKQSAIAHLLVRLYDPDRGDIASTGGA